MKTYNQTTEPTFADVQSIARQYITAKVKDIVSKVSNIFSITRRAAVKAAGKALYRYADTFTGFALCAALVLILYVCTLFQSATM